MLGATLRAAARSCVLVAGAKVVTAIVAASARGVGHHWELRWHVVPALVFETTPEGLAWISAWSTLVAAMTGLALVLLLGRRDQPARTGTALGLVSVAEMLVFDAYVIWPTAPDPLVVCAWAAVTAFVAGVALVVVGLWRDGASARLFPPLDG